MWRRPCDALAAFGAKIGLGPRALDRRGLVLEPTDQHVRFLRELRPGTPYFLRGGAVHTPGQVDVMTLTTYSELVQTASGEVAATFRSVARLRWPNRNEFDGFDDGERAMAVHNAVEIPPHGQPRGLTLHPPRDPAPTLDEAERLKLIPTFEGVVRPSDCDVHGEMLPRFFMARVSDAIPNLLVQTSGRNRGDGGNTRRRGTGISLSLSPPPARGRRPCRAQRPARHRRQDLYLGALAVRCRNRRGGGHQPRPSPSPWT